MKNLVLNGLKKTNAKVVVFDIDGTLKDLCAEHNIALIQVLTKLKIGTIRRMLVLAINKLAMTIVKLGILPTNQNMQNVLVVIYALMSCKNIRLFKNEYFEVYKKQLSLFNGVSNLIHYLEGNVQIYFATINKQNYNLKVCGISEDKIIHCESGCKASAYKALFTRLNVDKNQVLIIGDNFFDDLYTARILGVRCLLVNNYNSKLKNLICKIINSG